MPESALRPRSAIFNRQTSSTLSKTVSREMWNKLIISTSLHFWATQRRPAVIYQDCLLLEDWTDRLSKASVTNCQSALPNIPEERASRANMLSATGWVLLSGMCIFTVLHSVCVHKLLHTAGKREWEISYWHFTCRLCVSATLVVQPLTYVLTYLLLTYFLTYLFTHFLTFLLTYSLTFLLSYLLTHSLTQSLTHSLSFLLTYLLTHSLTYLLTYLLTH